MLMCAKWEAIETAPKDGTRVLLGREGWVAIGRWDAEYQCYRGAPFGAWRDDHDWGGPEDRDWPTKWQPLPAPPEPPE